MGFSFHFWLCQIRNMLHDIGLSQATLTADYRFIYKLLLLLPGFKLKF